MRIKYTDLLQIMHYINGDNTKVSSVADCTTITELRELLKDTPIAYKIGGDLDDVEKRIEFRIENLASIEAYEGTNKDYTPTLTNFDYCMDEPFYYGTSDRAVGQWVDWLPNFEGYRYKGNIGWLSNTLFDTTTVKRMGGYISGNIDMSILYHNDLPMLKFNNSAQIDFTLKTINNNDEINYYNDMSLWDNAQEEPKNYFYVSYGNAEYGDEFRPNFLSESVFTALFDGIFATGGYIWGDVANLNMRGLLKSNVWLFDNESDLNDYLRTGDHSKAINDHTKIEDESTGYFYYDYKLYRVNENTNEKIDVAFSSNKYFKLPSDDDTVAFVKVVNPDVDNQYELQCTSDVVLALNPDTQLYDIEIPFTDVYIKLIRGQNLKTSVLGDVETNIQFVDKLSDANYKDKDKLNPSYNGKDSDMDLTDITIIGGFITPYYLTVNELNGIAAILFTNDTDLKTALQDGLWMYSGNPIDCIVDVCLYPFDISIFADRIDTQPLKFGSFTYNGEISSVPQIRYNYIKGTNKSLILVNQRIIPIYNDFRDYDNVTYQLFLPYCGLIELDNIIVGRTLKIEAKIDVFTAQLKYYIFIDSTLYGSYECSVGRHISVIGTDWISKSSKNLDSFASALQSTGQIAQSIASGNALGIAGGITNTLQAYRDYAQKPNVITSGNNTSGLNIYDPLSCYLITTQYESIKPANLNKEYGIPCYKIAKIGTCKGFTEITDVKLKTRALKTEIDEILSILRNGVII